MPIPSRRRNVAKHARQEQVARLYESGMTMPEIAAYLGVNTSTISRDIKELDERRIERAVDTLEERREREIAKLLVTELEAREAWKHSVGVAKKVREETNGYTSEDEDLGGAVKRTEEFTELNGDPRYLSIVLNCIQERAKLQGLYAATRIDGSGDFVLKVVYGDRITDTSAETT